MTQQSHLWVCTQKNRKQELAQILVHPGHGSITHDGWKAGAARAHLWVNGHYAGWNKPVPE